MLKLFCLHLVEDPDRRLKYEIYKDKGALVKGLWEETHVLKVVGLIPSAIYWMNIFTLICCKIVLMFV